MDIKEQIKQLRDKGVPIYSISRLNTVDECPLEYRMTYYDNLPSKDNIYGLTGGAIHKCLENIQNGIKVNFSEEVDKILNEAAFLGIKFPTENIEEKWKKNILTFAKDYKAPYYEKKETEKPFLVELEGHYLQGIIDLLIYNEDGTVSIVDYKTSSKFTNAELQTKGRQLILYGVAMEQLGYKVKSLAWNMLKYVEISYTLKNGKTRTTIAERGFVLDKLKSDITKELKALNEFSDLEIEALVDTAVQDNSFENLPASIRDKYTINDYFQYYDYSQENIEDLKKFIKYKIEDIENNENNEDWWEPKEIEQYTAFYCKFLCGQRQNCQALQDFLELEEAREERKADLELAKFI